MKLAVVILLLLSAVPSQAQTVQLPASPRSGSLAIRVLDTAGLPIPGVAVLLRSADLQPRLDVVSFSAANTGMVQITHLPPGAYQLIASLPGFASRSSRVHVFPNDDQSIDVHLHAVHTGCVAVSDTPPHGAISNLSGRPPGRFVIVTEGRGAVTLHRSRADGTFAWCDPPTQSDEVSVVFEPIGRAILKPAGPSVENTMWTRSVDVQAIQQAARTALLNRASPKSSGTASSLPQQGSDVRCGLMVDVPLLKQGVHRPFDVSNIEEVSADGTDQQGTRAQHSKTASCSRLPCPSVVDKQDVPVWIECRDENRFCLSRSDVGVLLKRKAFNRCGFADVDPGLNVNLCTRPRLSGSGEFVEHGSRDNHVVEESGQQVEVTGLG